MKGTFQLAYFSDAKATMENPPGWFTISHRYMPDKPARRFAHGRWYAITSGNATIYRILRFSPKLRGSPNDSAGQILLDWPGWLDLHGRAEDVDAPLELTFTAATRWQYPKLALAHPDPTVRLAGELGLLSAVLGVLSILLAVLSFF